MIDPDPVDDIPVSDEEPSEDESAEEPIDLRRTLDSDNESGSEEIIQIIVEPEEIHPAEDGDNGETSSEEVIQIIVEPDPDQLDKEIIAAPITVFTPGESWNRSRPHTLKDTCIEARKLADRMESEDRLQISVLELYDELVTKLIIHLDSFELGNSPTLRAARKQTIARLGKAQMDLENRIILAP